MTDIQQLSEEVILDRVAAIQRLIPKTGGGFVYAYDKTPRSIDDAALPAFVNWAGLDATTHEWAGSNILRSTATFELRFHVMKLHDGIEYEVQNRIMPYVDAVVLHFSSRPMLQLNNGIDGIVESALITSTQRRAEIRHDNQSYAGVIYNLRTVFLRKIQQYEGG